MPNNKHVIVLLGKIRLRYSRERALRKSNFCLFAHCDNAKVRNANHITPTSCSKTVGTGVGSAVGAAVGIGVGAAVGTFETLPSWPLDKFVGSQIQKL